MKKSRNAKLAGVCGGLAEHFGLDPLVVRLLFVFAFIMWGVGIVPYIVLWLFMDDAA
jgi:phage shock protein PspC (stress-responsive transcriptional regulator)